MPKPSDAIVRIINEVRAEQHDDDQMLDTIIERVIALPEFLQWDQSLARNHIRNTVEEILRKMRRD